MLTLLLLSVSLHPSFSQERLEDNVRAESWSADRSLHRLNVDLVLNTSGFGVHSNRMVMLTPRLVTPSDTLNLSSVGLMGRRRYYYYQRNEERYPEIMEGEHYRVKECPDSLTWMEAVPYESWMNGASLEVHRQLYGCCSDVVDEDVISLGVFRAYDPVFSWITPVVENPKVRKLEGSAFIDFVVSTTDIRPDYRENRREIGKILASIDSLRVDEDITIDSIWIKGFASPESPYSNNTRLAKGRTQALKDYVTQLYRFDENFIRTSYEPEDWAGLRRFVENSNLEHRDSILALIGMEMDPDEKESRIRREYPKEYRMMLDLWYPALRHSDYRIVYRIRQYDDMDEMKRIFRESPAKLSLREFFNLSSAYEPGTEEFCEVFDLAAVVYPHSTTANLNAANVAMSVGDLKKADRYLPKAGDSADAVYARGVRAALGKDYVGAKELFRIASEQAHTEGNTDLTQLAARTYREMDEFIRK